MMGVASMSLAFLVPGFVDCSVDVRDSLRDDALVGTATVSKPVAVLQRPNADISPRLLYATVPEGSHCVNVTVTCQSRFHFPNMTWHWSSSPGLCEHFMNLSVSQYYNSLMDNFANKIH